MKKPPTVPTRWADAKTSDELLKGLHAMTSEIAAAEAEIEQLEGTRTEVVLEGRDVGEHTLKLVVARERRTTFRAAHKELGRRFDVALERERQAQWAATAKVIAEERAPVLRDKWRALDKAAVAFMEAVYQVREAAADITNAQAPMANANRRDLLFNVLAARAEVAQEIGRPPLPSLAGARVLNEADVFEIRGRQIAELALALMVHQDDPHRATHGVTLAERSPFRNADGGHEVSVAPALIPSLSPEVFADGDDHRELMGLTPTDDEEEESAIGT